HENKSQVDQLEEAFLQQLQGTEAQLTSIAAALEAAQKDLAAARIELAHTKRQLTTTSIKLEQLRAQVAAANKGFSKDQRDKWNLLPSRVSLPFLRGMLSSQGTKPATQPACHPATQSSSLACPRNQECDTHTGGYTAEYILSRERLLRLQGVSTEQLGTLCTAVVGAVFPGADPGRQASATTHRRNHDLLQTYIHEAHTGCLAEASIRRSHANNKCPDSVCHTRRASVRTVCGHKRTGSVRTSRHTQLFSSLCPPSAKEAAWFTREQLRAYLLYHKVPPRDQPVGNTLVAGWQKAVHKHIVERVSPTRHGVLP
ncbi:hypothetical protein QJQ45_017483, partial [Haematococcus lacustris]